MKNNHLLIICCLLFFSFAKLSAQPERSDVAELHKWNFNHLYASDEEWRRAKDSLMVKFNQISPYKGTLTQSASNLLGYLELSSNLAIEANKLYTYAMLNADVDARNMKYSGMVKEMEQLFSTLASQSAFVNPEILSVEWTVIETFMKNNAKLEIYRQPLSTLFRIKTHSLSEQEETIMALAGLVTTAPQSIYSTFMNAEMAHPQVTLSNGETVTLNSSGYTKYRASSNRNDRQIVFDAYWANLKKFEATFGEMLNGQVKIDVFNAKARHYQSSVEAALYPQNLPVDVYHSLVVNVNKNIDVLHRYLKLKKQMLGVDTLKYLDLYAPTVKNIELNYTYEQAKNLIIKSLAPMGDDYLTVIKKAFSDRWIDVYPTKGKRSGAYSTGSAYDVHPYILMNYNGKYDDVSTLTHELGHTMQSYYSNKNQPYPISQYPSFVAEVASTFNEVLLFNEMLKTAATDDLKLSLLVSRLEGFRTTLFRQTQFAEFELKIHQAVEDGKPLTGQYLSKTYKDIVNLYYGHDKGICYVDDNIEMEWAFIPHFYYNFYVYQYSTSFVASNSLAEKVLNQQPGALQKYMTFLSTGGSKDAIEQLKEAGVDMTSSQPFNETIKAMNGLMDQIELLLKNKK